jgi:hypothetical protein
MDEWREPAHETREHVQHGIKVGVENLPLHTMFWAEAQHQGYRVLIECRVDQQVDLNGDQDIVARLADAVRNVLLIP